MSAGAGSERSPKGTPSGPELGRALDHLEATLRALLGALEGEAEALAGAGPTALEAAVRAKEEALARVERAQAALEAAAGARLPTLLRRPGRWATLRALLARCRERNTRNGGLIVSSQQRVQEALAVLRAASPAPCYGPEGAPPQPPPARSLGKA